MSDKNEAFPSLTCPPPPEIFGPKFHQKAMKLTYFGHSSFSVQVNGRTLLFDPFISPNPLAKNIDVNTLAADYILLSHGHQDHLADAESIARRTGVTLISNFEIAAWFA